MSRTASNVLKCLTLALVVLAVPAAADPVVFKGLDTWYTPAGGAEITTTIPAGTFCGGTSNQITRTIKLEGVPVTTAPALTDVDTIIERLDDAVFDSNNEASSDLVIVILSLRSVGSFSVNCGTHTEVWKTRVQLAPTQTPGTIEFVKTSSAGGTFSASFPVTGELTYINAANSSDTRGPFLDTQTVTTASSDFSFTPTPDSQPTAPNPVWIDTDYDGIPETNTGVPTGPNFWIVGTVEHEGPHPDTCAAPGPDCPEWEPPTCTEPWVVTELKNAAVKNLGFVFAEQADAAAEAGLRKAAVVSNTITHSDLQASVRRICVDAVGAQYLR